ncbi:MAG: succinate dehydrogenase assembly factor 2 [Pseudomonadota bacterium]
MKELDVVLTAWLDRCYASASATERAAFHSLLELEDPDLAVLVLGAGVHGDPECDRVIQTIRRSAPH